jgi:hypothetical protein
MIAVDKADDQREGSNHQHWAQASGSRPDSA